MFALHITGIDEASFTTRLHEAMNLITSEGCVITHISHAANITDGLYVLYSVVIVYAPKASTR